MKKTRNNLFLLTVSLLFFLQFSQGTTMSSQTITEHLTLYFIPSPHGIDWSTPSTLAKTAMINKFAFKTHFMGHVWAEIECKDYHNITGMSGKDPDYLNQILIQGKGLGVLFHSFPGHLENKNDIEEEKIELFKDQRINFVRFTLSSSQCLRAKTYMEQYKEQNLGRYYGLVNRPRYKEGSGCSAFGASFLDILNLLDEEMKKEWSYSVNIPNKLIGPPLGKSKVSLLQILLHSKNWAQNTEPHTNLTFWDPDKMYHWVKRKVDNFNSSSDYKMMTLPLNQEVKGLEIDKSHLPVPEDPLFKGPS